MRLYDITVFVSYVGGVCGCAFLSLELVLEVAVAFQTPPWFHICIKCVLCRLAAAQAALHYHVMQGSFFTLHAIRRNISFSLLLGILCIICPDCLQVAALCSWLDRVCNSVHSDKAFVRSISAVASSAA